MTPVKRMTTALALAAALAAPAHGQSREQLEKWVQNLNSVRLEACAGEDKKKVTGRIEYAATLIAHSEVEEAEMALAKAAESAAVEGCKQALARNGKLSSVQ